MRNGELREPVFWILTSLAGGRQHGYAIIQAAAELSDGRATIAVTTLYASLERLEQDGLVRGDGDEVVGGRLRRYFAITPDGEQRLADEAARLDTKLRVLRARLGHRPAGAAGGAA
ncbi:PadR family transcriptional regulator [Curtobacterium sp. PhB115]|uniref:PadR family transcriptional regulator n=1 Tax=Curtobacterium sp. PhB115 TaxID=2485173 RepID=UPI000F4CA12D|nr:PadR family transcriptional regulator [Curtobacterium sp. PhB115]ROP74015.1 DNA-binding PadR family transcriptional regulator [Curtobacterium sp. PhB115]